MTLRVAVAAGHFGPDVAFNLRRVEAILAEAAGAGAELLVLPHGLLTGYHDHLTADADASGPVPGTAWPEAVCVDGPEVGAVVEAVKAAGRGRTLVACFGITEAVEDDVNPGCLGGTDRPGSAASPGRANTALCVDASGVLGAHRKVHLPAGEVDWYRAGDGFAAVATPVGRLGLLVDYDKTFPEAARCLALDGAQVLVCPCAWPASRTNRADSLARDRQRRLFDLYDRARAAENQVWLVAANQIGRHGALRFLGQSKVVRPDGEVVAAVGARAGLAVVDINVASGIDQARRHFHHLHERRPDRYAQLATEAEEG
jgi:nitrilase